MMRHSLTISVILIGFCVLRAGAAVYYVDSSSGHDAASGLSAADTWATLASVNSKTFAAGDCILFKAGTRYEGELTLKGSGTASSPIFIDMYGGRELPRIDADGKTPEALLIQNQEYWEIRNLELTNEGPAREAWRAGVRAMDAGFGAMRHIHLADLYVHDVNGNLTKSDEGCGIYLQCRGGRQSHFEDLRVERCHVVRTDRNGICQRASGGARSTGVIIRHNLLEDIGGDGIKIWGSSHALVEKNVVRGGEQRAPDASAGIWPWDADHTVIQYNEVSGMHGSLDGQGFDSDYQCRDTIIQYNFSHDNDGGFLLVCGPRGSINDNSIIRYNISQNDGIPSARVFQIAGSPTNTHIYNNTIYVGPKQSLPLISFNAWNGGWPDSTVFSNNLFYVDGKVTYRLGEGTHTQFAGNIFYCPGSAAPPTTQPITVRPDLVAPGSATAEFASLACYGWANGTTAPTGVRIDGDARWDILGHPIDPALPPTIGAVRTH
jgi:hypothetical protein